MQLTEGEKNTAVWQKIYHHLEEELDHARLKLESATLTWDQSNVLRGRIQFIRHMLDLDTEKPFVA